jgi:glycosyltransferase involved in cell wall biosynthesis
MENRRVLEYYRTHPVSAFVNVSASEGLPVAVMEAFSFGIPAIATDVGGTHEIVSDGGNGFLIPQDFSPEQLLEAFCRLEKMTEPDYQNLCAGARKTWEEKFSAAKNYGRFYKEIGTWN